MDKPSEQALNPAHARKSGKDRDSKSEGDTDIGTHTYSKGNVREQLDGLWAYAGREVVGLPDSRRLTNCYRKTDGKKKESAENILDSLLESGPPAVNSSKPKRVF